MRLDRLRRCPQGGYRRLKEATAIALALAAALVAYAAHASGFRPFAVDDAATVERGGTVSVLTNGQTSVLANDFDFERDVLSAELTREPHRGKLVLNRNGTFVYEHDGSDKDDDEFRYLAFDGTGYSREAKVRISVTEGAAVAPRIVGQRDLSTAENEPIRITLADLQVQDPDSNYPRDFTLILGGGDNYALQGFNIIPAVDFTGILTVPTQVNDGQANSNVFGLRINVLATNDPPIVTQNIEAQEATEGEPFSLDVSTAFLDPDAGDRLTFTAQGLPASNSLRIDSVSGLIGGTPVETDALVAFYSVTVTATDQAGSSASTQFTLRVIARQVDLAISARVQPEPATVGTAPQWSLDVRNASSSSSDPLSLVADWYSTGAPVVLSPPAGCIVSGNSTFNPQLQCEIDAIPADGLVSVRIQSTQSAPGDQAIVARLALTDANQENNSVFKSLNIAGSFNQSPAQRLPGFATDLAIRDLNADDLPDLVAVANGVSVYFNMGDKTLASTPLVLDGDGPWDRVALLDWNDDLSADIVALDADGGPGRVFLHEGAGSFAPGPQLPGVSTLATAVLDLNQDGFEELVVVGNQGTVLLQPGMAPTVIDARGAKDVATADFNGDGRMDLAVALQAVGAVVVLEHVGDNVFNETTLDELGVVGGIGVGDVSNDGAPDLLLPIEATEASAATNLVLLNNRDGSFMPLTSFGATDSEELLAVDVNDDDLVDIVTINATGVHQIYLGNSLQEFALQPEFLLSPGARKATLADLDADGVPDLFLGGADAPSIEVLRNNGIGRFGPGDITPPVIQLIGATEITVKAATSYVDPGATATDDVSGDVTAQIVVTNPVNPALVGTYTVTYDVVDRAGNASPTAVRTVRVQAATDGGGGGGHLGFFSIMVLGWLLAFRRRTAFGR